METSPRDRWRERFQAGNQAYRSGSLDFASVALREAVDHARGIGPASIELATTLNTLAAVEAARSIHAEAEELYREALGVWEQTVGADHAHVAATLTNLALLCQKQERWADADAHISRALDIDRRTLGNAHPNVAMELCLLASIHRGRKEPARAEEALLEAVTAWPPTPIGDASVWQTMLEDLASLYGAVNPGELPPPKAVPHDQLAPLIGQLDRAAAALRARGRLVDASRVAARRKRLSHSGAPAAPIAVGPGGRFATIAEALAHAGAGAHLALAPGTYEGSLVLRENALIEGTGARGEVVVETDGRAALRVDAGTVTLRGITLRASGFSYAIAVELTGGSLVLEDCEISSSAGDGIEARGDKAELALGRCRIHGCRETGVRAKDGARVDLAECDLERNATGIHVAGSGGVLVRATRIASGAVGLSATDRARPIVQGATITGQSEAGVRVREGANPTFSKSRVSDCGGIGLAFESRSHGLFEDSEIVGCSGALIAISGGASPRILRCRLHDGGDDGLLVKGEGTVTLLDSELRDMGKNGVSATGGTLSLRSCRVNANRRAGLSLSGRAEIELDRCDLDANGSHGVLLAGNSRGRMNACKITGNRREGIAVEDGSIASAVDCDLRGNGNGAWLVGAGCHADGRGNQE